MTKQERAEDIFMKILDFHERVLLENAALKVVLSTWDDDDRLNQKWEETKNRLLADHNFLTELHATHDALRLQFSAAIRREVELGMLLALPTSDQIN